MDFFEWVHYEWWHVCFTMMTLSWTGAYDVIFLHLVNAGT